LKTQDSFQGKTVTRNPKKDAVTRWAFGLEPHARKPARMIPRGEGVGNNPDLLDIQYETVFFAYEKSDVNKLMTIVSDTKRNIILFFEFINN